MKRVRYTKYNGDLASEMEMDDLLKALSDYLLDSGYRDPFTRFSDLEQTMSDLKEAIRRRSGGWRCCLTRTCRTRSMRCRPTASSMS